MIEHKIQNIKHTRTQNSFKNSCGLIKYLHTHKKKKKKRRREEIGNERLITALNHMHKLIPVRL